MRKLSFCLLCGFFFSVPWEAFFSIPGIGTVSRVLGVVSVAAGVLAIAINGYIRKPGILGYLATGFTLIAAMSLFWTVSFVATVSQVLTYVQLLGLLFVTWEFARREEDLQWLLIAYCLGAYLSIASSLINYSSGLAALGGQSTGRYAATNFDPNDFGLTLALGIPLAWYLFLVRRGLSRLLGMLYVPLAAAVVLLTASRAAFVAATAALSIIPLTTLRRSVGAIATFVVASLLIAALVVTLVPQSSWDRIFTARSAASTETFGGRMQIWTAGIEASGRRPLLGYGAGTFRAAIEPIIGQHASHNVLIAVLVEQGIAGLTIFVSLIASSAWLIYQLRPPRRTVWSVIALTWLPGAMTLDWHYSKVTWLLFGVLSATAALERPMSCADQPQRRPTTAARRKQREYVPAGFVVARRS